MNLIKTSVLTALVFCGMALSLPILAQETEVNNTATQEISLDTQVSAQDLDIKNPNILPDSPFYFLKNWIRKIETTLTFNKLKKAELENKYANEKLLELRKLTENNANAKVIEKAAENYQKQIEKIKEKTDKIKETTSENQDVDKFLQKFTNQQILQEKILQKLETQVPAEALTKIQEARNTNLTNFGQVMTKLENRNDEIKNKVENALDADQGSKFKNFQNLETLQNIAEKIPEQAKEAIQQAQENALKRLQGDLGNMSPEDQQKFKDYIDNISGDKQKQAEILDNIKSSIMDKPQLQEKLIEIRQNILEKVGEVNNRKDCLFIEQPSADFCKGGRIIFKKDGNGCVIKFVCVIPTEEVVPPPSGCKPVCREVGTKSEGWYNSCTNELIKWATCGNENPGNLNPGVCITLWDPVCGKNNKTYSNKCFAKLAGIGIAYLGECVKKDAQCSTDADCGTPNPASPPADSSIIQYRCINNKCTLEL